MSNQQNNNVKGVTNISTAQPDAQLRKERFRPYRNSTLEAVEKFGNVVGRIYANETHAGGVVVFKVEITRLFSMSGGSGEAFSFEFADLADAGRCVKWAQKWIWRVERRRQSANRNRW